eukprot:CAMPEP_0197524456 /NCGR_PEP_ID=MMETSP1318-20131121/9134_1 /TAXON_ID=552666 /ORGANISM="Partenskyella glossopodia, Strain RCC365" /LENGTH=375 /DNA_ID=CAMNT_0043077425 /DNA_START=41 /DNA_END=1165 /DNA_ORIENTATION=+
MNVLPWKKYPLHIQYTVQDVRDIGAKYSKKPPRHIDSVLGSLDDLPLYQRTDYQELDIIDSEDEHDADSIAMNVASEGCSSDVDSQASGVSSKIRCLEPHRSKSERCRPAGCLSSEMKSQAPVLSQASVRSSPSIRASIRHTCTICGREDPGRKTFACIYCKTPSHLVCLAREFRRQAMQADPSKAALIPEGGNCPCCEKWLLWPSVVESHKVQEDRRKVACKMEKKRKIREKKRKERRDRKEAKQARRAKTRPKRRQNNSNNLRKQQQQQQKQLCAEDLDNCTPPLTQVTPPQSPLAFPASQQSPNFADYQDLSSSSDELGYKPSVVERRSEHNQDLLLNDDAAKENAELKFSSSSSRELDENDDVPPLSQRIA